MTLSFAGSVKGEDKNELIEVLIQYMEQHQYMEYGEVDDMFPPTATFDLIYVDGDYYTFLGGVGGGYGAYIKNIERVGDCVQVTYCLIHYYDGPLGEGYSTRYALMTYKEENGLGFWSVYRESDQSLVNEAEGIECDYFAQFDTSASPLATTEQGAGIDASTGELLSTEEGDTEETGNEEAEPEEVERKKGHGTEDEKSGFPWLVVILSSLGALLLGGGVTALVILKKTKNGGKQQPQQYAQPQYGQPPMQQPVQPQYGQQQQQPYYDPSQMQQQMQYGQQPYYDPSQMQQPQQYSGQQPPYDR